MPYQSLDSVRIVDPILTNVAHGYRNNVFVGNLIFPLVEVQKRKGRIIRFNEDELYLHEIRRSPGSNTTRVSGDWGSDSYELYQDAIEEEVPYEFIEEAEGLPMDLSRRAVNKAMYRVALRLEFDQLSLAGNLNSYPVSNRITLTGTSQFSDPASNPESITDNAHQSILANCGMMANCAVMSLRAYDAYKRNPLIRDKFKYTSAGSITKEMLAGVLGVKRLEIAAARYKNPSNPALGRVEIFQNSIWMGYNPLIEDSEQTDVTRVTPSPNSDIDKPSFGYTYQLKGMPVVEEAYRDQNKKVWLFPVTADRRPVLTGMGAGYLITNVSA